MNKKGVTNSMNKKEVLERDGKYVLHGLAPVPIVITEAHGSVVKDIDGKEYLDFNGQTSGVIVVGHDHPRYIQSIKEQADRLVHTMTGFVNTPRIDLAEKLAKLAPGRMRDNCKTYFSCGGSEATEIALRFAMLRKKKYEVISVYGAYHGRTLATVSLIGQSWRRWNQIPAFPGFHQIPSPYCYRCYFGQSYPGCNFECARSLEHHLRYGAGLDNVAAFIIEPIQGNGGHVHPPSNEYWKIIREICNKYDVLLILDEVQTGIGRTGTFWASDQFEIEPDIMTSAKALGGGMPISATMICSDLVTDQFSKSEWAIFSLGGGPLPCAVASTTLDIVQDEKLVDRAAMLGKRMTGRLKEMEKKHPLIGEVRGKGVFLGVELVKDRKTKEPAVEEAETIAAKVLQKGLILNLNYRVGYGNVLKIKPPLTIEEDLIDKGMDILDETLSEVEKDK